MKPFFQPGSFEFALCYLIDRELDLAPFHARYRNDYEGAPAYDPAVLLKIVLLAYSRGIVSSRRIEAACRDNVVFIAASGDTQPNFTTLAAFVSELGDLTAKLFAQVLTVCDRQGLIGREMFAIDGVKLPSNASKAKSGSRADFQRQAEKMEKAAKKMLDRYRNADAASGNERELLLPVVTATAPFRTAKTVISADAGYHAEANLKGLAESKVAPDIPTRVIASGMNAMPDRLRTRRSPIRCRTNAARRQSRTTNSSRKTSCST